MEKRKIVVVGAGPAGLAAAYELSKESDKYDVVVLEKLNQVGGISKTLRHNGNRMDIGGHRFFSKDDRVMNWWFDIMPIQGEPSYDDIILNAKKPFVQGGPDPEKSDEAMLIRKRVSRIYYLKKFFDYPVSLSFRTLANMGFVNTVKVGFSYLKSLIKKRTPEETLEDFMINRFGVALYRMFFENYTEKVWGRHPSKISASWGAQRIKGLSIREILKDMFSKVFKRSKDQKEVQTSLIEQFYYPKFGPGQLWELVADKAMKNGVKVLMDKHVTNIECSDGKITSVKCSDGSVLDADIFISSMPIKDLITAMPESNMSSEVRETAIQLPYRDFITVGLLVNKLNIKNKSKIETVGNIIPDCWIYVQEAEVKLGRLQIFNNWSPYMVSDIENKVWIGLEYFCNEGDDMWMMPDDEFISMAAEELHKIGIINKGDVIDSVRVNVEKAYPAYFGSYENFPKVKEHIDLYDNLYCIGRNGQHRYNNMDHSMLTAFCAVEDIKSGGKLGKETVWGVNVENEYHEKK